MTVAQQLRQEGRQAGRQEGRKEGRQEEKLHIAKNMLLKGFTADSIRELLDIGEEELKQLVRDCKREKSS